MNRTIIQEIQEEKAKRYDEVVNKLRRFMEQHVDPLITRADVQDFFPELAESEDEKIRNVIRGWIYTRPASFFDNGISKEEMLAWLEKQGEQKLSLRERYKNISESEWFKKTYEEISVSEDEESKWSDKVQPKFHEGDWVVNKFGDVWHIDSFDKKNYQVSDGEGNYNYFSIVNQDEMRLWTIQDAKDGDVLVSKYNQPFIYNGIFDEECVGAYCGIDNSGDDFLKDPFSCNWSYKEGVKPATKEQHELLFTKMKDAGYEFNFEKKELKKFYIIDEGKDEMDYCFTKMMNGKKINSTWIEEDEEMVNRLIGVLDGTNKEDYHEGWEDIFLPWLKSLKDKVQLQNKWTPNKDQIIALRWVLNNIPYNKHKEEISGLLDQIKDL